MRRLIGPAWLIGLFVLQLCGCTVHAVDSSAGAGARTPPFLPHIIAHRGGTADAPENTLVAIRAATAHHADAIWLTVQLSRDGIPVLYRPAELSALTDASGPVAARTAAELARVNAGWTFRRASAADGEAYPYRRNPVGIPTLREALQAISPDVPIILDMKALPAAAQIVAVAQVLNREHAWSRVTLYSTEAAYQQGFSAYPQARMFEARDATRTRLVRVLLNQGCIDAPDGTAPVAFELHRDVTVVEQFTLGEGRSPVRATLWTPATVACTRRRAHVFIVAIGVNDEDDYRAAACLDIDAVLADSPRQMRAIRAGLSLPLQCPALRPAARGQ
jgi:glycerophosphoryl diester phosphodiesterase